MKLVLQRVKSASVKVDKVMTGSINYGLLIYLGIGKEDTNKATEDTIKKILSFRIFADENGKMNLNILQAKAELLIISQFTLYADNSQNRPGFTQALEPEKAKSIYNDFLDLLKGSSGLKVESGVFGAHMEVQSINDGPVTFVLEF